MVLCHSQANFYQSSQDALLLGISWVHAEPGKEGLPGGPGGSSQWLKAVSDGGWQHPSIHQIQGGVTRLQLAVALTRARTHTYEHTHATACNRSQGAQVAKQGKSRQPVSSPAWHHVGDGQTDGRTAVQQGSGQPLSSRRCRLSIVCPQAPSGGKSSPGERRGIQPSVQDRGTAAQSASRLPNCLVMHCVPARLHPRNKCGGIYFNRWRTIFSQPFN